MHCLFIFIFSFDSTRCQSVNGPTPGDYKLQIPIEHAFIDCSEWNRLNFRGRLFVHFSDR